MIISFRLWSKTFLASYSALVWPSTLWLPFHPIAGPVIMLTGWEKKRKFSLLFMDQKCSQKDGGQSERRKLINFYCLRVSSLSQNYESYSGLLAGLMKASEHRKSFEAIKASEDFALRADKLRNGSRLRAVPLSSSLFFLARLHSPSKPSNLLFFCYNNFHFWCC
jgi:hypothetical protein